nr:hypothetical protein [Tanacetum cinerariifolium]
RCFGGTNKAGLCSSWHGSELEAATNRFLFIASNSSFVPSRLTKKVDVLCSDLFFGLTFLAF